MKVIKSGNCVMGVCGTPTPLTDIMGKELFVGDVVALYYKNINSYEFSGTYTYIADGQFDTFSNGAVVCCGVSRPFVMGIKDAGIGDKWQVKKVKKIPILNGYRTPHSFDDIELVTKFRNGYFV
jgi:hypothetical protein